LAALGTIAILTSVVGCTTVRQTAYNSGGSSAGSGNIPSAVGLEVFGSQPNSPTDGAMANPTTWGAVYGGQPLCANEAGSRALVQRISGGTPILFDRSTGQAWKQACHNRVTPFVPPSRSGGCSSGGIVQNSTITQNWKFSLVDDLRISINGLPTGGYGGQRPPQPCPPGYGRPMPRPQPCPPGYGQQGQGQGGGNQLYRNGQWIPQWGLQPSRQGPLPGYGGQRPPQPYPQPYPQQGQGQNQRFIVNNENVNNNNNNTVRYIGQ
jgi:hypothetical protein